ncbi:hypothetical protein GGR22_000213 [Flavobacterium gossypii]|uniref:Erythromycin esterase family protein n=1 Tax=Flavobacterium gossypii TaxID=1646119 RepID=A0ABR6DK85_9FLAO|nr:hypothetical protein [Flavobacterium gossypii]MBA9072087.1 hypothetical protein [Flavobacterium gossypii]
MKSKILLLLCLFCLHLAFSQESKQDYLSNNKFDLNKLAAFPQTEMKIIGFGAYHGSAKTEEAELLLLKSVLKNNTIRFYFPETDYSIAYFFNEYLQNGDEKLLKDLVETYGGRVPQERSVETFMKWRNLKKINDDLASDKKIKVLGADPIVSYKYTCKHLLSLANSGIGSWKKLAVLKEMVEKDTANYSPYKENYAKKMLREFVADYEADQKSYEKFITDKNQFHHLIATIKESFGESSREKAIYNNYIALSKIYNYDNELKFFRYGFAHLMKIREDDNSPSFFTQLIENKIYKKEEIVSILGYLTKSRVLWDVIYDKKGNYKKSTTEGGFGIGDYKKEYFKGIDELKKQKISDMTIFRLNQNGSPYEQMGTSDLMEVILTPKSKEQIDYSKKSTAGFIDYAVLISNSKANTSIYKLSEK